jgi:hypothetical protein
MAYMSLTAGWGSAKGDCKWDVLGVSGYSTLTTVAPQTWLKEVLSCGPCDHTYGTGDCPKVVYGYPSGYTTGTLVESSTIIHLVPDHSCPPEVSLVHLYLEPRPIRILLVLCH